MLLFLANVLSIYFINCVKNPKIEIPNNNDDWEFNFSNGDWCAYVKISLHSYFNLVIDGHTGKIKENKIKSMEAKNEGQKKIVVFFIPWASLIPVRKWFDKLITGRTARGCR